MLYETKVLYCGKHKGFSPITKIVAQNLVYDLYRGTLAYINQTIAQKGLSLPGSL